MNRQRFDDSASPAPARAYESDRSLLCSTQGCGRLWTCDFGKRLCSDCDARRQSSHARKAPQATLACIPSLREAVRPFAEPVDHDEDYVHDDRA